MNLTYVTWPGRLTDAFSQLAKEILQQKIPIEVYKTEQIRTLDSVKKLHHYRMIYKFDEGWNKKIPDNYLGIFKENLDPIMHTISEIKMFTFDPYSSLPLHIDIGRHCVINFPIQTPPGQKLYVLNRPMNAGETDVYVNAKADGTWNNIRDEKLKTLMPEMEDCKMEQCAILNTKVWHTVINNTPLERIQIAFEPHTDYYYEDIVKFFKERNWA